MLGFPFHNENVKTENFGETVSNVVHGPFVSALYTLYIIISFF